MRITRPSPVLIITSALAVLLFATAHLLAQAKMVVHYIDMDQADATLLEFPCGAILIDAGSESGEEADLTAYLTDFFQGRPDLNNTLNSIIITHNHIDHTRALRDVVEGFTVERYIDSGHTTGSGTGDPNWVRTNATTRNITVRAIADADITALTDKNGLTDGDIDPINCTTTTPNINPRIAIYSGRFDDNPGWGQGEFDNKNNHSLVVRVDFGPSAFLAIGQTVRKRSASSRSRRGSTERDGTGR